MKIKFNYIKFRWTSEQVYVTFSVYNKFLIYLFSWISLSESYAAALTFFFLILIYKSLKKDICRNWYIKSVDYWRVFAKLERIIFFIIIFPHFLLSNFKLKLSIFDLNGLYILFNDKII